MTSHQPDCCLCGQPCEPWHAPPTGYGHNPDPLGRYDNDRCCNTCNDTKVIPARLGLLDDYANEIFDQKDD